METIERIKGFFKKTRRTITKTYKVKVDKSDIADLIDELSKLKEVFADLKVDVKEMSTDFNNMAVKSEQISEDFINNEVLREILFELKNLRKAKDV